MSDEDHFPTVSLVMWMHRIVVTGLRTNHMSILCIVRKRHWGVQKIYFYWLLLQKCNFSQAQYKLPEDGPGGPKHVGAKVGHFNVNFNILYV